MATPVSLSFADCETNHEEEIKEAAEKAIEIFMDSVPYTSVAHLKRLGEEIIRKADQFILLDWDKRPKQ